MQTITLIVNGAPYGTEGPYNAFRLAGALLSRGAKVSVFLMSDAVLAAKQGQDVPQGYYSAEGMLSEIIAKGASVLLCVTCSNARGLTVRELVKGAALGSMTELARSVVESDKVICF